MDQGPPFSLVNTRVEEKVGKQGEERRFVCLHAIKVDGRGAIARQRAVTGMYSPSLPHYCTVVLAGAPGSRLNVSTC